ncbi:MAG TPA: FxsA family protein [Gemmatimonadota bacterium]|nr:FxsA family protein [Gemmatimonadota bacterium]
MFRRLLPLFIIVPIIELALLIQLGRWIGLWPTLGLIAATGILGAALASREGLRAWHDFQTDVYQGKLPGRSILDGLSIFAGGALLLTPGLITDLLGFSLVLRPSRRWLQDRVVNRFGGRLIRQSQVYMQMPRDWPMGESKRPGSSRPGGREVNREEH